MRNHLKNVVLVAVLVIPASALTASALTLTGTWEGTEKCTIHGSTTSKARTDIIIHITQSGTDINAHVPSSSIGEAMYNGYVATDAEKPDTGSAGMIACGSSPALAQVGEFIAKTTPSDESGKLKGLVVGTLSIFGNPVTYTCKYTLKRTDASDPAVAACP